MPLNPLSYKALFLSETALKEYSVINANVDMKMLTPIIQRVQDLDVLRFLGTGLLVDLQNKIAGVFPDGTSGNTLTSNDKFLLNAYIRPMMIHGVLEKVCYNLTYKYMNKGIEKMNSDNAQPANIQELQTLQDRSRQDFDAYAERLIFYLQGNQALFPAYQVVRTLDDVAPSVRGFRSPLYIGKGNEGYGTCDPSFFYR